MYMADVGRWAVVDPKSEAYYPLSGYQYALDNPIANFDTQGKWTVSRHYMLTLNAVSAAGVGFEQADLIAYYASVWADNPGLMIAGNNVVSPYPMLAYRSGIDHSLTEDSQKTDWEGAGYNNNIWHSMRSNWEKTQYESGAMEGISAEAAMQRGMEFGWSKIFDSAREGKLGDLKKNSKGIEAFGQGMHALQDGYAHRGVSMNGHSTPNDIWGNSSEAGAISRSTVMVHSIMSGDMSGFNKMLKDGKASLDLTGIGQDNLRDLYHKLEENGKALKYNWDTKKYDIE
jgi:hypothetical protein